MIVAGSGTPEKFGVKKVFNIFCHLGQFCGPALIYILKHFSVMSSNILWPGLHRIMMQKIWKAILPRAERKTQDRSSQLSKEQNVPEIKYRI